MTSSQRPCPLSLLASFSYATASKVKIKGKKGLMLCNLNRQSCISVADPAAAKHEIYAAAFGGHLFYDLFLQGREVCPPRPLNPLLPYQLGEHNSVVVVENNIGAGKFFQLYIYFSRSDSRIVQSTQLALIKSHFAVDKSIVKYFGNIT